MSATVHDLSMGRVGVTTTDRYGRTRRYEFRPSKEYPYTLVAEDGYTPVVLKALWEAGKVVDWSPDDLSASERAQLDGFCDDCGTAIHSRQVGRDEWDYWCPECDEDPRP